MLLFNSVYIVTCVLQNGALYHAVVYSWYQVDNYDALMLVG